MRLIALAIALAAMVGPINRAIDAMFLGDLQDAAYVSPVASSPPDPIADTAVADGLPRIPGMRKVTAHF